VGRQEDGRAAKFQDILPERETTGGSASFKFCSKHGQVKKDLSVVPAENSNEESLIRRKVMTMKSVNKTHN
jgi:hypothetical protein